MAQIFKIQVAISTKIKFLIGGQFYKEISKFGYYKNLEKISRNLEWLNWPRNLTWEALKPKKSRVQGSISYKVLK